MDKLSKWIEKGNADKLQKIMNKGSAQEKADLIEALGKSGNDFAVNMLIALLRSADPEVRKASVIALGETGEARATEFLRKITRDEPETEIAQLAREAMRRISESRG